MSQGVHSGFLRDEPAGGSLGALVTTGAGAATDALTDTQLRASAVTVAEAKSATATLTNVNDQATSTTLLAANANRRGATIANDSTSVLYLKLGATASATSFTIAMAGNANGIAYYEVPFGYTGVIDGIWASDSTGAARITEITA